MISKDIVKIAGVVFHGISWYLTINKPSIDSFLTKFVIFQFFFLPYSFSYFLFIFFLSKKHKKILTLSTVVSYSKKLVQNSNSNSITNNIQILHKLKLSIIIFRSIILKFYKIKKFLNKLLCNSLVIKVFKVFGLIKKLTNYLLNKKTHFYKVIQLITI